MMMRIKEYWALVAATKAVQSSDAKPPLITFKEGYLKGFEKGIFEASRLARIKMGETLGIEKIGEEQYVEK